MTSDIVCPHCGKSVEINEAFYKKELDEQIRIVQEASGREQVELLKQIRELKRVDAQRESELQKKLLAEEEKIRLDATKKAEENQHLKTAEMQKQLTDALKVNEDLRHKLQQGSQQNQGEVLELELENQLKSEFPNDKIEPVAKGIRGADLVQEVWDSRGTRCGVILWEIKNAKWSEGWIAKLKDDQRQLKSELAVIVSENLPSNVKTAAFVDQVWVCGRGFATGLAMALRANLIQAHYIRKSAVGKNEKMEVLYNYLSGVEFKQRVETIVDAFEVMREEIEKERKWFSAKWSRQEKSLRSVIDHTHGMHGDLAGIMGASLPEIKSLGEG